jgi:hypothetical protein
VKGHVTIVGVCHILLNLCGVVSALFAMSVYFFGASALGLAVGQEDTGVAAGIFGVMVGFGGILGCLALVPSLPGFVAGVGVLRRRAWARWTLVVVGALQLFSPVFPLGIYTLWVLLNERTEFLFKSKVA